MFLYDYKCVYKHPHTHTHTHAHTRTHIKCACVSVHVCMYVCMYVHTHTHKHTHTHTHKYIIIHTHTISCHSYTHTHTHTHTHIHTYIHYIHKHTLTHTYIHTHLVLIKLRTKFGIVGQLHSWLKSFLYNRSQAVKVSTSCLSSTTLVTCGVIQGALLGPILFSAYITDIVDCFHYGKPVLYADDLKVVFSINSLHPNNSYALINGTYTISVFGLQITVSNLITISAFFFTMNKIILCSLTP